MKLNRSSQSIKTKLNRPEKGGLSRFQRGSFRREGKKEGVWGRNFCLPVSFPFGFAQGSFTRRPRGGGRRGRELPRKLYHLFIFFFKISPNFGIEGQPTGILRFFRGFLVWNFQAASHFLPPELKVRLRKAQSSAPMVKYRTIGLNSQFFAFRRRRNFQIFGKKVTIFPCETRFAQKR